MPGSAAFVPAHHCLHARLPHPQALSKSGALLGDFPIRVSPSKTAIVPVNNNYLPRSTEERELVARTVFVVSESWRGGGGRCMACMECCWAAHGALLGGPRGSSGVPAGLRCFSWMLSLHCHRRGAAGQRRCHR